MANIPLYPLNNLEVIVRLETNDPVTGRPIPLTSGTVTAFIASANTPTATAADSTLNATVTYTGANGKWLVSINGSALTAALLASLFASVTPYLIVQVAGAIRVYAQLDYFPARPADVS